MSDIAAEVRRQLALLPRAERGPRGWDGKDAEIDADMLGEAVRAEIKRVMALIPKPKDGISGRDGVDGQRGEDGLSISPVFPLRAEFDRDPITHVTLRADITYQNMAQLAIVPIHDADGLMVAADFFQE